MSPAKRIILRVPEDEMNYQDPYQFVRLYFAKFPPQEEPDATNHFIHLQPPSDFSHPNPKIHIVIDLETQTFSGPLSKDFPHEIYAVRRGPDGMALYGYPEPMKQNLLQKIREFSDGFYPWGRSGADREAS